MSLTSLCCSERLMLCECGCGKESPLAKRTRPYCGHVKGKPLRFINGHNPRKTEHAPIVPPTPERTAYYNARARCNNRNTKYWKDYGGRGIQFLFTSFEQFFAEIGPRPTPQHSLDREDNDGNYAPGNVRWATKSEQQKNQRLTDAKREQLRKARESR